MTFNNFRAILSYLQCNSIDSKCFPPKFNRYLSRANTRIWRSDNPSHHAQHTKVSFPISTLSCKKNNPLRQLMLCKIPKLLITTWTWSRQPFPLWLRHSISEIWSHDLQPTRLRATWPLTTWPLTTGQHRLLRCSRCFDFCSLCRAHVQTKYNDQTTVNNTLPWQCSKSRHAPTRMKLFPLWPSSQGCPSNDILPEASSQGPPPRGLFPITS